MVVSVTVAEFAPSITIFSEVFSVNVAPLTLIEPVE
jgi:hypothetical protein